MPFSPNFEHFCLCSLYCRFGSAMSNLSVLNCVLVFFYSSPDDIGTCWYILLSGSVFIKESMFLPRSRYVSYECTTVCIFNITHEIQRIFKIKRQCLMLNETHKYTHKHTFLTFTSCGNCFIPVARIESRSLWTVYKHPKCHATAVNLKTKPPKT